MQIIISPIFYNNITLDNLTNVIIEIIEHYAKVIIVNKFS